MQQDQVDNQSQGTSQNSQKKIKDLNRSDEQGPCSVWEHIDMFKEPAISLKYQGSQYIKSSFGGIMTLLTVVIFSLCMMLKISSVFQEVQVQQYSGAAGGSGRLRLLQEDTAEGGDAEKKDAADEKKEKAEKKDAADEKKEKAEKKELISRGDTFFSEKKNFKWVESTQVTHKSQNLTTPINPFHNGLNKISIIFNNGNHRKIIEEMMMFYSRYKNDKHRYYDIKRSKKKAKFYKSLNLNEDQKFFRYELVTYYYKSTMGKSVKYNKTRYFDSMSDLYVPDGDDNYSIFPRIDLTDSIMMLGDYYSDDFDMPKAWTEFNLKIDWVEVQRKAFETTRDYFAGLAKNKGYHIFYKDCPKLKELPDSYLKNKKESILLGFSDLYENYDHKYKMKYDKLKKEIDIFLKKMRKDFYQQLHESETDAQWFYDENLIPLLDTQCFDIEYWKKQADGTQKFYKEPWQSFESKYLTLLEGIIKDLKYGAYKDGGEHWVYQLLDSIVVKIDQNQTLLAGDGQKTINTTMHPIFPSQNNLNWDCIQEAVKQDYDPFKSAKKCYFTKNIYLFDLNVHYAQDYKMEKGEENVVTSPINLKMNIPTFQKYTKEVRKQKVRMPPEPGQLPDTPFDTLWTAVFAFDQKVTKHREIWMIQDKDEKRTTLGLKADGEDKKDKKADGDDKKEDNKDDTGNRRLLVAKNNVQTEQADVSINQIIEIIAWGAGLWIFLYYILMKPIVQRVTNKNPNVRIIGNHVFYNELNIAPSNVVIEEMDQQQPGEVQ